MYGCHFLQVYNWKAYAPEKNWYMQVLFFQHILGSFCSSLAQFWSHFGAVLTVVWEHFQSYYSDMADFRTFYAASKVN